MSPVMPRFGALGTATTFQDLSEDELTARLTSLQETGEDIQFQNALSQMPVDELVIQLGREEGSSAVMKTDKSRPVLSRMLGLGEGSLKEFEAGFQGGVEEQKQKLIETARRRIDMIREELRSRITIAQGLGNKEVPFAPGKEGKEQGRGIEVTALERLLDRTA